MRSPQADPESKLETLKLILYLVPIFGVLPALWSLYFKQGSRREQTTSRTAVNLALAWLAVYVAAGAGSQMTTDVANMRFLVVSLLATTGYFITSLGLMVRLLQGHTARLPGITKLSDRLP